jgi:hemolysin activation/secretion protein
MFAGTLFFLLTPATGAGGQPEPIEDRLRPGEIGSPMPKTAPEELQSGGNVAVSIKPDDMPTVLIRAIKFEGTDVPESVADATRAFIARTLSRAALEELAAAMTAAYERSNVALFTIVIPEQNFEDGAVRVLVAEGHVGGVSLIGEAEKRKHMAVIAYAERLTREKPLSRKTLERRLSLIRDIPGLETSPSFAYGAEPGGVELLLALDYQKSTVTGGFSNRSSRFVKDGQLNAEGKIYRLLRDGDFTSLKLAAAANFKDSRYAGLQHTTPVGSNGARADFGTAVLRSRPSGTVIEGDAQLYAAGVSYPVIRSYRQNLSVRAGLDVVNSDNAAFGALIATEQTRAIGLSSVYSHVWTSRSLKLTAKLKQGLSALDAEVSDLIGEPEYFKSRIDASLTQKLADDIRVTLNAAGQWTDDNLPANERFSIGGATFGRAFSAGLISADRGYAFLVEPAWRPLASGPFDKSELYAFADFADVETFARPGGSDRTYNLGSYGAGLRAAYKDNGYLELELAHPFIQPTESFDQDWRFSITWRLNIRP